MGAPWVDAYWANASMPFVLGQPGRRPHTAATTVADLPGDGRSAKEFEVLRVQAVAEPLRLTFRVPLIRQRLGKQGSHVGGVQDQHAAVALCVDLRRVAHLGVLVVLGRVGDHGGTSKARAPASPGTLPAAFMGARTPHANRRPDPCRWYATFVTLATRRTP